jgi:tetratricopeptide (TPR) repeat protein
VLAASLALGAAAAAPADVLHEAQELRRQMRYDEAQERLGIALPDLQDDARARVLLLLAQLSADHREARRLLLEAERAVRSSDVRLHIDLELARLDYARGNYRSVLARLRQRATTPEAALLIAQAQAGIGDLDAIRDALQPVRRSDVATLLLGWAERQGGDTQRGLAAFESVAKQRRSDLQATALLWKAESEAALGLRDRALQSCTDLREGFPETPEATLVEPTLALLRRSDGGTAAPPPPEEPARVVLQVGAFEDRTNALRYRDQLLEVVDNVQVEEIRDGTQRLYRVHVGPFATRDEAEAYARTHLDPHGYRWRVARPGEGGR